MPTGQHSIESTLSHLPKLSEEGLLLDGATASQVRAIVERQNGGLGRLLDVHISSVTEEIMSEFDPNGIGSILIIEQQLRGVIARSAIYAVAQALYTTAESLEEAKHLDEQFLKSD